MAIQRDSRYPGRWEAADADYPLGGPKNRTTAESKDGTYLEKDWIADYEAFFQALMSNAGFSANGNADTAQASQFYDALIEAVNDNLTPPATLQQALDGADVDAYMPPDLVHAAFNKYGLGKGLEIPIEDIDSTIVPGIYFIGTPTLGNPFLNQSPAIVFVGAGSPNGDINGRISQTAHAYNPIFNKKAHRVSEDGGVTWSDWDREITESDKATTEQAQTGTNDEAYLTSLKGKQLFDASEQQIGVGQTWQDLLSSRQNGVTYTNNTGRPIAISASTGNTVGTFLYVDDVLLARFNTDTSVGIASAFAIVPNGSSYYYTGGNPAVWAELR